MLRRRAPWAIAIAFVAACSGFAGARALESWRRDRDAKAAEAALKAAKVALDTRSPETALPLLARAVDLRGGKGDGEAEFLLGACEYKLGRMEAAETAWSRVPPGSLFEPHAALYRARLVLSHDRFADAEPLLLTAMRGQGAHATEARETLVNLYKLQGRFDEARVMVLGAWGTYNDPAGLLRELEKLGSSHPMGFDAVRIALDKASRNAPDDDRIWLGWATLATRTGHLADARRRLDQCLGRRPADAAVWRARLDWAMAAEDAAEVERAVRHLPPDRLGPAEVLDLRAWFAARNGDVERERKVHEDLLAREPGSLRSLDRLATLALQAGRRDEAARLRQQQAALTEMKYRYQVAIHDLKNETIPEAARMAEQLGRAFEAYALWTMVAKANPNDRASREALDRLKAMESQRPKPAMIGDLIADLDAMPRRGPASSSPADVRTPEFLDDAEAVGLRFTFDNGVSPSRHMPETTAGGVGLLDYNGDGWLDVYLTQAGPFPPDLQHPRTDGDRLFRNRGDGTFEDATASAGLAAFARGYSHGVTVGDIDNDGHPDLFITRWHRYALYRNRGDGTFEDVTDRHGLGGDRDWPTSAAFGDFDGDGDLDLYVCHYLRWDTEKPNLCWDARRNRYTYCSPQYSPSLPDHLFRNDGGRFTDVTAEAGIVDSDGRGLGVVAADMDGDGRVDIYVANDQSANYLFRNKGGFRFEEVAGAAGVAASGAGIYQASMGIAHGDADGDGRPDLAITNFYNESTTLYLNRGDGIFTDDTAGSGVGRAEPVPARLRGLVPGRQQRRLARPGDGQRARGGLHARGPLADAGAVAARHGRRPVRRRLRVGRAALAGAAAGAGTRGRRPGQRRAGRPADRAAERPPRVLPQPRRRGPCPDARARGHGLESRRDRRPCDGHGRRPPAHRLADRRRQLPVGLGPQAALRPGRRGPGRAGRGRLALRPGEPDRAIARGRRLPPPRGRRHGQATGRLPGAARRHRPRAVPRGCGERGRR